MVNRRWLLVGHFRRPNELFEFDPAMALRTYSVDARGQRTEMRHPRSDGRAQLGQVRAFYLDIAQWAMEEPARWGLWAAPCPIGREDLARTKEIRRRKSRMDQRTRERLPALPALVARVNTRAQAQGSGHEP